MTSALIQSIRLKNFKRFENFNLSARTGNILVGPNNSGKSSILDALRMAQACLRFARTGPPRPHQVTDVGIVLGYQLPPSSMPIPLANVTTNYSGEDAIIEIRCSNGNTLFIRLNPNGQIVFYPNSTSPSLRTSRSFRDAFPIDLVVVPPLGPFEETEHFVTADTVRRNESTRLSNRYFRHIWHHKGEDEFREFQNLLMSSWPGMEIKQPEVVPAGAERAFIQMFYNESRIDRELYWSGFGFQVWLQMLTHILRGSSESILVLDEPDIYLHPDLQRKLLRLAQERFGQFFLATHSVEIINEASPGDVVSVSSAAKSARRVQTDEEYQSLFKYLGSVENIDFSRLGRARRLIFFEGDDKKLLRKFAAKLDAENFANDLDTMILQSGGFGQWRRVKEVAWTFKEVLKIDVGIFALFDRDYRSDDEVENFLNEINGQGIDCYVLKRKEIENYALTFDNVVRTIKLRQEERLPAKERLSDRHIQKLIYAVSNQFKHDSSSQIIGHQIKYFQEIRRRIDPATVSKDAAVKFDRNWKNIDRRLTMLAGKDFISQLSSRLQKLKGFSLTTIMLIVAMPKEEIGSDLIDIIHALNKFCMKDSIAGRA